MEQIPPTELWDSVYYLALIASRTSYTIIINITTVKVYCNNTVNTDVISAGEFITTVYNNQEYCGVSDPICSQLLRNDDVDTSNSG